ncbi:MAG: sec-independent translocase [Streptosporangiaceae bacterium]
MLLDLNFTKLLVLGVVALIVFGPERLPAIAAQAGRALREMRKLLDGAKSELQENLGPEFSDFDIADLNPRHFVRKHLVDEVTGDGVLVNAFNDVRNAATGTVRGSNGTGNGLAAPLPALSLPPGERPPFDAEAT